MVLATNAFAQEIKISGNSTEIVDGDAYPGFSDDTYFAGADVSGGTVSKTFTIENTGSSTLTLSGSSPFVSISGTNSADFSVTSTPSNCIAGSSSTTFTIEFDPSDAGPREAELTITNNDADEGTYNFAISGIGIGTITAANPLGSTGAQIGLDINGESNSDFNGCSVSLSSDGTIMAIGARSYDGIGINSGYVRVFKFSGGLWSQLGGDIAGEARGDESGYSISISGNGTVLAIGAPNNDGNGTNSGHVRVYQFSSNSWSQLGSDIDGESNYDYSGYSVSLSSDGTILAIGAPYNDGNGGNSGHVRVYKYSGNSWGQLGSDIDGEAISDESGTAVSLNSDGTILAIGAPYNGGNGSNSGHVRVYQFSSSSWSQLGGDIDGEASGDESGITVSLSSDGTVLAIGATENDDNGSASGHVRVYKYSGSLWSQLGSDIDGEASGDESGSSVSLSSDGTVLAIGGRYNDGNGSNSGHLRLYQYSSSSWTQLGSDIDGESSSDNNGSSVCLSSNASVLAIGAPYANSVGQVRTYALNDPEIKITGNNSEIEDGDTKAKTANNTYYGKVNPTTTGTISKAFTIKNEGVADLTLNGSPLVSISGNDASDFTVSTQPSSSTIAAGDSTTFIINFNPDTSGIKSATVSIASNDANENTFEFSIEGYSTTIPSDTLVQLHGDIDGEKAGDESGRSVSINADGRIVAIGSINNDGNGSNSGHVRVFQNTGISWSQIGNDFDGEAAGDNCGISVALSSDGTRLAIGARYNDGNGSSSGHVRVYELNSAIWSQLGSDIDGEAAGDRSGYSVAMNADGDRVAIGAIQNDGNGSNAGHVRIFEYNSSTSSWSQLGGDIDGETANDQSGRFVTMSADGKRVAIGTYKNDGNGTDAGHVRIFDYNSSTSSWSQLGSDIDGEAAGDRSGTSISMNENGSRVAIGAPYNDGNGTDAGHVRIFEYDSGTSSWNQLGADIDGEVANDKSGQSVSMSLDGNRIAISAINNDEGGSNRGHVRFFGFDQDAESWSKIGNDVYGEVNQDFSGYAISMSGDGGLVAIAALQNDDNGTDAGHVRIFNFKDTNATCIIKGNADIVNGDETPSVDEGTDFGEAVVSSSISTVSKSFSIKNTAIVKNLTLSGVSPFVSIGGTNSADFTIETAPSSSIGPASSTYFVLKFAPSAVGIRTATVTITSNDDNASPYTFDISGEGIAPEIKISGNSTEIVNGDVSPSTTDHTDFEDVLVSSGTVSKTFTIENTGVGDLIIDDWPSLVNISGTNSADFSLTTSPSNSISASSSTTFTVEFNPSAIGTRTATLTINSNDADEGTYTFDIAGEGSEPEVKVSGNSVEIVDGDAMASIKDHTYFGSVDASSATKTRTFTIENTGGGNLTLSSSPIVSISGTNSSDFAVTAQPSTSEIAANTSLTFEIEFDPSAEGTREAEVAFTCDDSDEGTYNFSISGLGSSKADYPFDWTWYGGSSTKDPSGVYGTKGTASSSNIPGGRRNAFTWKDTSGNVYLFGGYGLDKNGDEGYLNDFWKFDGTNWTWLSGSDVINANGTYGIKGTASNSNTPGARFGHVGYVDGSGNIWLFGGEGFYGSTTNTGNMNDLWKWDGSDWTWVGGDNNINQKSNYGTTGQYSSGSWPRGAHESVHWYDGNGVFWILGGYGRDKNNQGGQLNDLWKWNGSQWAFVGGSKTRKPAGNYTSGTLWPGGRRYGAAWVDASNNLWLFGGHGADKTTTNGYLNDLWKWNGSQWTWVDGDDDRNQSGSYGTQGKAASGNVPGGRRRCSYWLDGSGNMTIYGGYGYDADGNLGELNDMWTWDGANWAWTSGEKTYQEPGNFGTLGTSSSDNYPGAKHSMVSWIDNSGNLWLMGGEGYDANSTLGYANDLWKMEMAYIWNGTSSTWNTNGNWKHGGVANSNYPVQIPSGLSTYPTVSSNISLCDIEIEDGASFSIASGNTLTITNTFEYKGSSALNLGDGTLKFNGTSTQTIDGKIDGNVEIDNSNDVTLGAASTITSLTLTNGDLDIGNNDLTLGSATGGSSSSYIKVSGTGTVTTEVGSSPVTLPIGRNPYLPIIIDDGGGNDYTVGVYDGVYENPETESNAQTDNVVSETWTIQSSASQNNVSVTVQWELDEEEGTFDRSNAYLGYWENGVSSVWNNGTSSSAAGSGPYTLTRTVDFTTNLFYFGVGSAGSALPVDFTYFTAQWQTPGETAILNWQTAIEENNSHFEIQRSFDGQSFETIGAVQGQGSTFETTDYQFIDEIESPSHLGEGFRKGQMIYYRLKQIDYNGDFDYSAIKTLDMETEILELFVFPNPAFGNVINASERNDTAFNSFINIPSLLVLLIRYNYL
ncbi:MAG: choice-of-anchor D domain-containing protein, partial [Bacteroidia bacterium]